MAMRCITLLLFRVVKCVQWCPVHEDEKGRASSFCVRSCRLVRRSRVSFDAEYPLKVYLSWQRYVEVPHCMPSAPSIACI